MDIYSEAMRAGWNYSGDINLEYGGFFWRTDEFCTYYVEAIEVTPCSDAGGPDNKFHITTGTIYMPDDEPAPLDIIGVDPADATLRDKVEAWRAYHGIETDSQTVVRIGKDEESDGWNPEPDTILRGNASLARYVVREFLRLGVTL